MITSVGDVDKVETIKQYRQSHQINLRLGLYWYNKIPRKLFVDDVTAFVLSICYELTATNFVEQNESTTFKNHACSVETFLKETFLVFVVKYTSPVVEKCNIGTWNKIVI